MTINERLRRQLRTTAREHRVATCLALGASTAAEAATVFMTITELLAQLGAHMSCAPGKAAVKHVSSGHVAGHGVTAPSTTGAR